MSRALRLAALLLLVLAADAATEGYGALLWGAEAAGRARSGSREGSLPQPCDAAHHLREPQ